MNARKEAIEAMLVLLGITGLMLFAIGAAISTVVVTWLV